MESAELELLSNWSIYTINNEMAMDFMVRYESLAKDLEKVMQRIGLGGALRPPFAKGVPKESGAL